jgi:NAD(P)-dependent dehydrogenase (short-subunit alcohol dehydrogenase family)
MGKLDGKTAYITGGASGMGRASARLFAREGASVLVADIQEAAGEAVVEEIVAAGGTAVFHRTDVTREDDIVALVKRAVDEFGALHIAYNNAGVGGPWGIENASVEELDRVWAVVLRGSLLGMKHAVPALREAGGGSILMTASGAGIRGRGDQPAYSALKAGLVNLAATASQPLAQDRIRVNAIAPGWIRTPMMEAGFPDAGDGLRDALRLIQPYPEQGDPEHVAAAALFLASDEAAFITGVTLPVDGGLLGIAPELPDGAAALGALIATPSAASAAG